MILTNASATHVLKVPSVPTLWVDTCVNVLEDLQGTHTMADVCESKRRSDVAKRTHVLPENIASQTASPTLASVFANKDMNATWLQANVEMSTNAHLTAKSQPVD